MQVELCFPIARLCRLLLLLFLLIVFYLGLDPTTSTPTPQSEPTFPLQPLIQPEQLRAADHPPEHLSLLPRKITLKLPTKVPTHIANSSAIAKPKNTGGHPVQKTCEVYALTTETWHTLRLDEYLLNIPGGKRMSLIDYATSLNSSNFACGVGAECNCGQMCYPVGGNDWYILFAVQQWNVAMNIFYLAVGYAVSMVKDSVNVLISSLFPAADIMGVIEAKDSTAISAAFSQVSGTIMMDVLMALGQETGPIAWALDLANLAIVAGLDGAAAGMKTPRGPVKEGFSVWTDIAYYLDVLETASHNALDEKMKKIIKAPISSPEGIYGTLLKGEFMNPRKMLTIPDVEANIRTVAFALATNEILATMNAFVTIDVDGCEDKGINGAWPQPDKLSWCSRPGGEMWNIIRAAGNKSVNEIPNAVVIDQEFGFSTQMITHKSYECQNKYQKFRYNPYTKGKLPKSSSDECVFNLPVCDYRTDQWGTRRAIKKKHWHVAEACKFIGHLPI